MRLSLRMLLDYLDDRLEPELARQIGDHVQEQDKLRQLVDRIKRVIRRRRLNTPDVAEIDELPVHHEDDPNLVAAYLDGCLDQEHEADFDEICVDTDVYLAEVAACHQIMSLGDQVVKVPPFARQRMYGLVDGLEAQPLRVVPREPRPTNLPLWEVDGRPGYEDETQAPLEPLFHDVFKARWRQWVPLAAVLLLSLLIILVMWRMPAVSPPGSGAIISAGPAPAMAPAEPKTRPALLWPTPVIEIEGQPAWQLAPQAVAETASLLAARPALPANLFLGLGAEATPVALTAKPTAPIHRTDNEPVVPLPPIEKLTPHMPPPNRDARVAVGVNGAETLGMVVRGNGSEGRFVRPQEQLVSNEALMALPGYTGSIVLPSQVKLTLVGQFTPNLAASPYAESLIDLHAAKGVDADVTLHRGRMVVAGRPTLPDSKVWVRYHGEGWELMLHPNTEVGVQATARVLPGDGDWKLRYQLELIVGKGRVDVSRNGQTVSLAAKGQLSWNTEQLGNKPGDFSEIAEVPTWLAKRQTAAKEFVDSLIALRSRTHAKLQDNDGKDMSWFRLACEESLEERRLPERQAALLGLAAVDHLAPVVRLMDDPSGNGRRKYAHDVVHLWLNQLDERADALLKLLADASFSPDDAKLLLTLFRSVPKASPAVVQALLTNMNHPQIAIREQAFRDLSALEPDRPGIYDAASNEDQRLKAIEVIRNRLSAQQKGAAVLPP